MTDPSQKPEEPPSHLPFAYPLTHPSFSSYLSVENCTPSKMENQQQQPPAPPPPVAPPPYPHAPFHHLLQQQQQQQLQMFWNYQRQEIEHANDFKNHQLPLARIKKIMKADEDVRMISAEAPILFAKACELFILELTIRSWLHAEENKRRTLQKNDIAAAITRTDIFDFLVDIAPRDEIKDEALGLVGAVGGAAGGDGGGTTAAGVPYYYPPMMMGQPAMGAMDPGGYGQQQQQQWQPAMWQQQGIADGGTGAYGGGVDGQGYVVGHQHQHHPSTGS